MNSATKALQVLRTIGIRSTLKALTGYRTRDDRLIQECLRGKAGLEVGGPSRFFRKIGLMPIYPVISSLDGVNFGTTTIWEGQLAAGRTYRWRDNGIGTQFIHDAVDLASLPDDAYDFVLSCNSLEHIANPIRALREWLRVTKPGGHLLLVLPNRHNNFDHRRPVTPFRHLLEDEANNIPESDLTHLAEILELHDLSRDRRAGSPAEFRARSEANFQNRCLHHHVFDVPLLREVMTHLRMEVLASGAMKSDIYAFGRK